jgi:hypothetical protein
MAHIVLSIDIINRTTVSSNTLQSQFHSSLAQIGTQFPPSGYVELKTQLSKWKFSKSHFYFSLGNALRRACLLSCQLPQREFSRNL